MKKKILSLALALALALALVPAANAATLTEGDWEYTVSGGSATITRNLRKHGGDHYSPYTMAIPSTIGGYPVTAIGDMMINKSTGLGAMGRASVTELIIPYGVITIGEYAFDGLNGLTSLTIPDSVTTIGTAAFRGCLLITNVNIGNGVTTIGNSAFSGCRELTSVTIPRSVTTIGYAVFTMNGQPLPNLTIRCYENSAAHIHAKDEGLRFELLAPPPLFSDLAGVSSEGLANIEFVYENGLMAGSGGNFMPTQAARNAQFLAILSRLAGAGVTDGAVWFAPYVDWARDFGIIEAGEFNADGDMAREDMALWMYRYITISGIELPSLNGKPNYQDIAGLSEEQRIAAEALFDWGIIRGSNPGVTFGTGGSSERVALANVLARFVRMLP